MTESQGIEEMAQAEFHEILDVDCEKLFAVIVRYEEYPQFVENCTSVKVERKGPGQARATYQVSLMKDVTYTLEHREEPSKFRADWTLVESDTFKKNTGSWELKPMGPGKTDVRYQIEVEFKIPVPGFILNRLVKGNLPAMVKSFQDRARRS